MKRRDFLKLAAGIAASIVLPSCMEQSGRSKLLKNENKPGFYIRFYKSFKPVDASKWLLDVDGLCENPRKFPLSSLKQIPKTSQTSRLKCVECWSAKAKWSGFRPKALFDIVKPSKDARFLYFLSADDYYEYISIDELLMPRVLFAYEMNDEKLPDEHGAPLRLIIPFKYGYKNVKTIMKLSFVEKGGDGYWSQFGYSAEGTILPGEDYPLDIGEAKEIIKKGELDY